MSGAFEKLVKKCHKYGRYIWVKIDNQYLVNLELWNIALENEMQNYFDLGDINPEDVETFASKAVNNISLLGRLIENFSSSQTNPCLSS